MSCDTCEQSRSIDIEHDRGDRLAVTLIIDPAEPGVEEANAALLELLEGATWDGQVRETSTSAVLADFDMTVDIDDDVLTAIGVILDTDDFTSSCVFDFQATLTDGGTLTFLGGSTITVIGDVTRTTGS